MLHVNGKSPTDEFWIDGAVALMGCRILICPLLPSPTGLCFHLCLYLFIDYLFVGLFISRVMKKVTKLRPGSEKHPFNIWCKCGLRDKPRIFIHFLSGYQTAVFSFVPL